MKLTRQRYKEITARRGAEPTAEERDAWAETHFGTPGLTWSRLEQYGRAAAAVLDGRDPDEACPDYLKQAAQQTWDTLRTAHKGLPPTQRLARIAADAGAGDSSVFHALGEQYRQGSVVKELVQRLDRSPPPVGGDLNAWREKPLRPAPGDEWRERPAPKAKEPLPAPTAPNDRNDLRALVEATSDAVDVLDQNDPFEQMLPPVDDTTDMDGNPTLRSTLSSVLRDDARREIADELGYDVR